MTLTPVMKKKGRPSTGEDRETLIKITFKADQATLDALDVLQQASPPSSREVKVSERSALIRRAIIEAAKKIDTGPDIPFG